MFDFSSRKEISPFFCSSSKIFVETFTYLFIFFFHSVFSVFVDLESWINFIADQIELGIIRLILIQSRYGNLCGRHAKYDRNIQILRG